MMEVAVKFVAEGMHHWPAAPPHRAYLARPHRHLFTVIVGLNVTKTQREIEFHDLLDCAVQAFGSGDFGPESCEEMARGTLAVCMAHFRVNHGRCEVWEDGECGAIVTC